MPHGGGGTPPRFFTKRERVASPEFGPTKSSAKSSRARQASRLVAKPEQTAAPVTRQRAAPEFSAPARSTATRSAAPEFSP